MSLYDDKSIGYFDNERSDFIDWLPDHPVDILEVGCGTGSTAVGAFKRKLVGRYLGFELSAQAASVARTRGLEIVEGNIEAIDLRHLNGSFDVLWASEVLEHLLDPWEAISRLATCVKPGGAVVVSTPNIAHRSVIYELLRNRFDYTESGVMDRTHLRWFTPHTLAALVSSAGVEIRDVRPGRPLNTKARLFDYVTGGRMRHLLHTQTVVIGIRR